MNAVKFDTDDAIFWQEVRQAYESVALNPQTKVTIERSSKKVVVTAVDTFVSIVISEVSTTITPTLVMP